MPAVASGGAAVALACLLLGALSIASSGIFVRLSETGPEATAFWRGALALPGVLLWALLARRREPGGALLPRDAWLVWAGVFFAGDLALWHLSLMRTSIAASTLEANLAPLFVVLLGWLLWRERPRPRFLLALALALAGLGLMVLPKLTAPHRALDGDLLGIGTACFYAAYIIAVARLRTRHPTGVIMLWTTLIFTVLLLPLTVGERMLPVSAHGWAVLVGLALIAQLFGQGLIAYALAHLPAAFGAVALYTQPIASALYAWLLLGERLAPVQIAGAVVVLGAIGLARSAVSAPASRSARTAP